MSYIDGVSDEVFANYPLSELVVTDRDRGNVTDELNTDTRAPVTMDERSVHVSSANTHASPLQKLFLSKSTITDASMFRLSFLSQLLEIRLQWCSSVTDQGIMALTINCPKLQEIDLKSCQITDASLEAIANNCANLRSLDLSWCVHISDSGIVQFSERTRQQYLKSYPSRVQEEVSDIFISEKEASLIDSEEVSAALVALDSLKMQSRVADGSARAAPSSSTCVGLKNLNLVWCEQLTDLSVAALMAIPTLQHVDVSGCAGLSYSLLLELQAVGVVVKSNSS